MLRFYHKNPANCCSRRLRSQSIVINNFCSYFVSQHSLETFSFIILYSIMAATCEFCHRKFGDLVIVRHQTLCMARAVRRIAPFDISRHFVQGTTAKLKLPGSNKIFVAEKETTPPEFAPIIEIQSFYDDVDDLDAEDFVNPPSPSPRILFEKALERQSSLSIPSIPPTPRPSSAKVTTAKPRRHRYSKSLNKIFISFHAWFLPYCKKKIG